MSDMEAFKSQDEGNQVVIETANRHNPSAFGIYKKLPPFSNLPSALTWFNVNSEDLNNTSLIFRIRRLSDDLIWNQDYIELNMR